MTAKHDEHQYEVYPAQRYLHKFEQLRLRSPGKLATSEHEDRDDRAEHSEREAKHHMCQDDPNELQSPSHCTSALHPLSFDMIATSSDESDLPEDATIFLPEKSSDVFTGMRGYLCLYRA